MAERSRLSVNTSEVQPKSAWQTLLQPMVNYLPKREVFNVVLMSIAKAFADMNVRDIGENDRDYLVNELTDNIIAHYPAIRLSEIPDAIWLGVRGKYGEFYGFSVVTFERFIEQYLLSEKRTQAVKELPQPAAQQPPDLQTQFATAKHNALQALQRKKEGRDTSVIAPAVYNFLNGLQLLAFTRDEKYDMLADAVRELIADLKIKLTMARGHERISIKRNIQDYEQSLTHRSPLNHEHYNLAIMRSKKLALDAFLNNTLLEETNLDALIQSRQQLFFEGKQEK